MRWELLCSPQSIGCLYIHIQFDTSPIRAGHREHSSWGLFYGGEIACGDFIVAGTGQFKDSHLFTRFFLGALYPIGESSVEVDFGVGVERSETDQSFPDAAWKIKGDAARLLTLAFIEAVSTRQR